MIDQLEGTTLSDYHLLERIGQGGMTTVYKAVDLARNRLVALKVLSPYIAQEPGFKTRFQREIELLRKLEHPNIVQILDFGEDKLHAYIAMPFFSEGTLQDRIRRAPLDPFEVGRLLGDISSALAFAHRHGVVHRDVKASNILIDKQGRAHLADFGFAHIKDLSVSLTGSALIGTPAYMSPEQSRGAEIDERSDQYSLGVVLYLLFTGVLPFAGDTPMAVAVQHINEPLPHPRKFKPDLPERVSQVILRALAKDPEQRFESIAALNSALQGALKQSVNAFGQFIPQKHRFNLATWMMDKTPLGEPISTISHWWNARRPAFVSAILFLMLLPTVGYALASLQPLPDQDPLPQLSGGNDAALQATIDALSTSIALESGEQVLDPAAIQAAVASTLSAQARSGSGRPTVTPGLFATPSPTPGKGGNLASLPEETEVSQDASATDEAAGGDQKATATPRPTGASTSQPTSQPQPTSTPRPPTGTPRPQSSDTPQPAPSDTPRPAPSSTPQPAPTNPPPTNPPPTDPPPPTSPPPTDPPPQPTDPPDNGGPPDDVCEKHPDIPPCQD